MTRWLFRLDVGVTDDLAPPNAVALHALGKVVWRACNRKDEARLQHALAGLRIFEDAPRFGVELVDDLARRAPGGDEAVPRARFVAREDAHRERRHLGNPLDAFAAADPEHPKFARLPRLHDQSDA